MATPTRKRKVILLETKYEIIQCIEMGNEPKKDVAARFDILPNTLSGLKKSITKISQLVDQF